MGRQGVRQDIQRFVKDVRHLVLEVLGSHCVVKHEVKNEALLRSCSGYKPRGFRSFAPYVPLSATIYPQAPPTFELISNAFHR